MLKGLGKVFIWILSQPIFTILILLAAGGSVAYIYDRYQSSQSELRKLREYPQVAAAEETKTLLEKVGRLIDLPKDETPTIATVTDAEKLLNQPFFASTQNGDKVLIYTQAKKAVLFRPGTGKIINVAPVNIGEAQAKPVPVKVAIYNGTATVGLAKVAAKELKKKVTNIEIVLKENAKKSDYTKTLVVDLAGNRAELASQLAQALGGEVSSLPKEENKPEAEVLVIIGSAYKKE